MSEETRARSARLVQFLFRVWSPIYDQPFFQRPFYRRVHAAVHAAIEAERETPRHIVDLGCGTGQLTDDLARRFPSSLVVGVDLSDAMLQTARRRLGSAAPPLLRGNVYALPLASGSVDLMTSTISYHWYLEPRRALAEIRRVIRPGGRFILATMVPRLLPSHVVGKTRFSRAEDTIADLRASGFRVEDVSRVRPVVRIFTAR